MKSRNHTTSGRVAREQRQHDAALRKSLSDEAVPPDMQVRLLDDRLGENVGARRERDRLAKALS